MTADELRAKFEKWSTVERRFNVERHPWRHGGYCYTSTDLAWEAWQAAHASRDAEVEALKYEVDDLAALVRRLAHSLDKPSGNTLLARQARDYLRRHDLQGSPMREGK